jgi:hypothetical protein
VLLDVVQQINNDLTIHLLLRDASMFLSPAFQSTPGKLKFLSDDSRRVTIPRPTTPSLSDRFSETGATGPVVVKPENFGFRNMGSNLDKKRDMIGGASCPRGEVGAGKYGVPSQIDEGTI